MQHGAVMHTPPQCVRLSVVCLPVPEEGSEGSSTLGTSRAESAGEKNPHRQEERRSLSVSSAARERWIYHGFPFLPCFIWQFIILSAGTGRLPQLTPSLARCHAKPGGNHAPDPGKMPAWTT